MSYGVLVLGGNRPGVIVLGVNCPGGNCPGGSYPGGNCPWGNCPDTILHILLTIYLNYSFAGRDASVSADDTVAETSIPLLGYQGKITMSTTIVIWVQPLIYILKFEQHVMLIT